MVYIYIYIYLDVVFPLGFCWVVLFGLMWFDVFTQYVKCCQQLCNVCKVTKSKYNTCGGTEALWHSKCWKHPSGLNLLAGPSYRTPACPSCNKGGWIDLKNGEWKLIPIQLDPASIPVERVVLASCTSLQKSAGASVFRRSSPSNSPEVSIFAAAAALSQRPFKLTTLLGIKHGWLGISLQTWRPTNGHII